MRGIRTYGGHFERFMQTLATGAQRKVKYALLLLKTQSKVSEKFVKHIEEGIYELRAGYDGDIYRVFFIFDKGNIVVLFNGFQKKTQKTPRSEIEKAKRIRDEYYGLQR